MQGRMVNPFPRDNPEKMQGVFPDSSISRTTTSVVSQNFKFSTKQTEYLQEAEFSYMEGAQRLHSNQGWSGPCWWCLNTQHCVGEVGGVAGLMSQVAWWAGLGAGFSIHCCRSLLRVFDQNISTLGFDVLEETSWTHGIRAWPRLPRVLQWWFCGSRHQKSRIETGEYRSDPWVMNQEQNQDTARGTKGVNDRPHPHRRVGSLNSRSIMLAWEEVITEEKAIGESEQLQIPCRSAEFAVI